MINLKIKCKCGEELIGEFDKSGALIVDPCCNCREQKIKEFATAILKRLGLEDKVKELKI